MTLHAAIQNVRFYLRDMEHSCQFGDDQIVATAPLVPPDGGSPSSITISDLRFILERHPNDRWNIEEDGTALLICRGLHDKADACEIERYVPESQATTDLAARFEANREEIALHIRSAYRAGLDGDFAVLAADNILSHFAFREATQTRGRGQVGEGDMSGTARAPEYAEEREQYWLDEAQRLAALVTALGGNPEPGAVQPVDPAGQERRRTPDAEFPDGVMDHTRRRLEAISALFEANGQPDIGHIAFLLRLGRSYVSMPKVDDLARERMEICRALGCIDKPGVPKEFILKMMERLAKAHAREVELIRSWDKATPTERQELDRMRRGWGPSTPTERNRRHADVLGCLQVLSVAMADLAPVENTDDHIPEAANNYLEAAYDGIDKRHTEMLAIVESLNKEPMTWPDIRAAEERGAMAMRRILKERVSGLKIIERLMHPQWEIENAAFDGAVYQIEIAPLPRDYHGSARDDVAEILDGPKAPG